VLEKGRIIVEGPSSELLNDEFIGKAYLGNKA
jgi:ABC-type branched-subunit amino acid transport system ATPase component